MHFTLIKARTNISILLHRILLDDLRKDSVALTSGGGKGDKHSSEHKSYLKKTAEARKQIIHYETKYGTKFDLDHNMNI